MNRKIFIKADEGIAYLDWRAPVIFTYLGNEDFDSVRQLLAQCKKDNIDINLNLPSSVFRALDKTE